VDRTPSFLKWLASSLVGIALFTGLFLLKGNGRATPLPPEITASASPSASQEPATVDLHNLLITVARDDQRIAGSVLVLADENIAKVRMFTVSPRVVIDTQGSALTDLATAGFQNTSSRVQKGLEDASGVRIDGSLVLQRLALAGLVDSVHGIDIVNPSEIRVRAQKHRVFTIAAGAVHLDGIHAAAYALVKVAKEPRTAQPLRINRVLQATFAKLPRSEQRMKETLSSLGSLSRTTLPTGDVARYLVRLNQCHAWNHAQSTPLATVQSALGGKTKTAWERFDLQRVNRQVEDFTESAFTSYSKSNIRVAVSGNHASDRLAARRDLRDTPFVFVDGGEQTPPKITRAVILANVAPRTVVALRQALGLGKAHFVYLSPDSATASQGSGSLATGHRVADITVTLGVDYRALRNNQESVK